MMAAQQTGKRKRDPSESLDSDAGKTAAPNGDRLDSRRTPKSPERPDRDQDRQKRPRRDHERHGERRENDVHDGDRDRRNGDRNDRDRRERDRRERSPERFDRDQHERDRQDRSRRGDGRGEKDIRRDGDGRRGDRKDIDRSDRDKDKDRRNGEHASASQTPNHKSSSKPVARTKNELQPRTSTSDLAVKVEAIDPEEEEAAHMKRIMGFANFRSTKNTKVPGNDKLYGVRKEQKTEYRQYMNRVGGFNRPLSPSR